MLFETDEHFELGVNWQAHLLNYKYLRLPTSINWYAYTFDWNILGPYI